jgi:hypothetical protein
MDACALSHRNREQRVDKSARAYGCRKRLRRAERIIRETKIVDLRARQLPRSLIPLESARSNLRNSSIDTATERFVDLALAAAGCPELRRAWSVGRWPYAGVRG